MKRGYARFICFLLTTLMVLGLWHQVALTIHAEEGAALFTDQRISSQDTSDTESLAAYSIQNADYTPYGVASQDPWWLSPDFAEGDYSMVVLPDTQYMVGSFVNAYYEMMQWIADNRDTLNIQAVMHMGDMVNKNTAAEWTIFKKGTDILDEAGIPWMPMMGNHDGSDAFNKYFDYQTYGTDREWFGGSYHEDKLNHTYWFVTVGDREYMILSLGWAPKWDVLDWAKGIVEEYPEKNVIITCHALVNTDGTLLSPGKYHSITADMPGYPDGDDLWEAFKDYENVVLAMSGHVGCPDIVPYVDQNGAGEDVYALLIDNQTDGISNSVGMIAVLTFHQDSDTVELNWYSTKLDAMYGPENQYAIHVPHVNSGTTEEEDITQFFTDWTTGGPVQYGDGIGYGEPGYTGSQDAKLKYSDYICIEGYDRLELTICARNGYTSPGGFAFYTAADPSAFISYGSDARTGNGAQADGTVVRTVAVPEGARYIRVTYWADSSSYASVPFQCVGYRTIPACDHDYQTSVIAPTCTEQGYSAYTCTLCGNCYRNSYVPATGHSYGQWRTVAEATCDTDGQEQRVCETCKNCETAVIVAFGHSYVSVVTEPTCTLPGYTSLVCTRCGYTEPKEVMVDITDQFVWTSHTAIQATTGTRVSDGNWQSSDYVDISGYSSIEILTANTAAANSIFGIAFYDGNKNYVSGIRHTDGSGVYGVLVHNIDIPENVVYIRTTWYSPGHTGYSSTFGDFYCLGTDSDYMDALGHTPDKAVVENEAADGACDLVVYCTACGEELSRVYNGVGSFGDVNGDGTVNIMDANLVAGYYNEILEMTEAQLLSADVNGDSKVDILDANMIVAYYNEVIDVFPAEKS